MRNLLCFIFGVHDWYYDKPTYRVCMTCKRKELFMRVGQDSGWIKK